MDALRKDLSAVRLDDVLHNRQTEARASLLSASRFLYPVKALEDVGQIVWANSHAVIANIDPNR
jgi:hypothetical protein